MNAGQGTFEPGRRPRILYSGEGHPIDQGKREEVFAAVREWFAKQGVK